MSSRLYLVEIVNPSEQPMPRRRYLVTAQDAEPAAHRVIALQSRPIAWMLGTAAFVCTTSDDIVCEIGETV